MYLNPFDVFDNMDLYSYFWLADIVDLHEVIWGWQCWSAIQPKGPTAPSHAADNHADIFVGFSMWPVGAMCLRNAQLRQAENMISIGPSAQLQVTKLMIPLQIKLTLTAPTMTFVDSLAQPQCWWVVYSLLLVPVWLLVCCVMQVYSLHTVVLFVSN